MKLIHNQYCTKSQCAVVYLAEKSIAADFLDYMKEPMNSGQIQELLQKLNIKAEDLVRKSESVYRKNFQGKNLTEQEWIDAMVNYPILIERPIFVNGDKAVIARPIERINEIL